MEVYIGIAIAALVIVAFGMLATSLLGIKERSYEEALAEQRVATNELLGLSSQSSQKSNKTKEKKMKKIEKKNKDKLSNDEKNISNLTKVDTSRNNPPLKHHVEFKEAEVMPDDAEPPKKKVQNKNEKVRPILVHRQEADGNDKSSVNKHSVVTIENNQEPANHFEEIHPKDDLELLQTHLKEESKELKQSKANKPFPSTQNPAEPNQKEAKKIAKQISKTEVPNIIEKPTTSSTKTSSLTTQPAIEETISSNNDVTPIVGSSTVKEKKKKSNASGNKQLSQQNNGVATMASLFPLVRNAELSRSEVQKFIDMLLNKQLEAPSVLDEWSEGRSDPLQKMKRQLSEREKQLESEQEAKVSLQQKLVKLREELNGERVQWIQRTKILEESIQVHQQAAHRHSQQIQQMQAQITEAQKLREDHMALQRQHKQLEIRATQVAEVEEARVNKLIADNQEKQAVIGQQRMDLCNLTEQLRHASDKLSTAGMDLVRKDEHIRELEQARINIEHQHEADFNQMQSHLQQQSEAMQRYEFNNDEMQKQRNNSERLIAQLRSELTQTQDQSIHGALAITEAHQVEVRNLQNELSSLRGQLNTTVREHKRSVDDLEDELEEQKEKNNEEQNKARSTNETAFCLNFIERLFPTLQLASTESTEDMMTEAQITVQSVIDDLDRSKTTEVQLQTKIECLQEAILDSDTMLKNLYIKIQQEEIDWRSKINEKDAEINRLQEDPQLQMQITELQLELSGEQDMHRQTEEQLETLKKEVETAGSIMQELQNLKAALKEDNTLPPDESIDLVNNTSTINILENTRNNCTSTNGPAASLEETNGK